MGRALSHCSLISRTCSAPPQAACALFAVDSSLELASLGCVLFLVLRPTVVEARAAAFFVVRKLSERSTSRRGAGSPFSRRSSEEAMGGATMMSSSSAGVLAPHSNNHTSKTPNACALCCARLLLGLLGAKGDAAPAPSRPGLPAPPRNGPSDHRVAPQPPGQQEPADPESHAPRDAETSPEPRRSIMNVLAMPRGGVSPDAEPPAAAPAPLRRAPQSQMGEVK